MPSSISDRQFSNNVCCWNALAVSSPLLQPPAASSLSILTRFGPFSSRALHQNTNKCCYYYTVTVIHNCNDPLIRRGCGVSKGSTAHETHKHGTWEKKPLLGLCHRQMYRHTHSKTVQPSHRVHTETRWKTFPWFFAVSQEESGLTIVSGSAAAGSGRVMSLY